METSIQLTGMDDTIEKMNEIMTELNGPEYARNMRLVLLRITASARRYSPADTGRLRNSIVPDIRWEGWGLFRTLVGVVGTNVFYAPFMELGTRHMNMPPPSALQGWANRRAGGASGYTIAKAIYERGGLDARKFLQRALEDNESFAVEALGRAVTKIVTRR